jgi:DNA modification methylase
MSLFEPIAPMVPTVLQPHGFFQERGTVTIVPGNAMVRLAQLPENTFQCAVTSPPYYALRSYLDTDHADKAHEIGNEVTPQDYITNLVNIFRELRRVMRPDGVFYLNIGDTYASPPIAVNATRANPSAPLKHKDLIGIPWMLAFAMRDDGWYLRSEIIWHKKAIMPESTDDRPTNCHEKVFMFTKSPDYFWDQTAVLEPGVPGSAGHLVYGSEQRRATAGVNAVMGKDNPYQYDGMRNIRNVWTINPATNMHNDHYATMPETLVEPCIKSGTSEYGCCSTCGAPWVRTVTSIGIDKENRLRVPKFNHKASNNPNPSHRLNGQTFRHARRGSNEFTPSCTCPINTPVPCQVIDPFGGTGTTGIVAAKLSRHATMVELSEKYIGFMKQRFERHDVNVPYTVASVRRPLRMIPKR